MQRLFRDDANDKLDQLVTGIEQLQHG